MALDFGLRTMFATDGGDLLGRNFLMHLKRYDKRITKLATHRQKSGLKVRSPRYDYYVQQMRGFLETEVSRVLNRLVEVKQPAHFILEALNFRNPNLSRRMNRLVQNCGRGIVKKKLIALEEELGITHSEVPAAYTSQECHRCGYVDRRNRTGEVFNCLWCNLKGHSDVNGARTIARRRSLGEDSYGRPYLTKSGILGKLTDKFVIGRPKRHHGPWDGAPDPRWTNPYFKNWVISENLQKYPVSEQYDRCGDVKTDHVFGRKSENEVLLLSHNLALLGNLRLVEN